MQFKRPIAVFVFPRVTTYLISVLLNHDIYLYMCIKNRLYRKLDKNISLCQGGFLVVVKVKCSKTKKAANYKGLKWTHKNLRGTLQATQWGEAATKWAFLFSSINCFTQNFFNFYNVCSIKICAKLSSVLLQCLVWISMKQTLAMQCYFNYKLKCRLDVPHNNF